jgi:predicted PurR-regulated permease PerM
MSTNARPNDVHTPTIGLAIRLGFVGLLAYWSFRVAAPFFTIGLWSAVLAVALYPSFTWLAKRLGPGLAATAVAVLCLIVVIGPMTWLGFSTVTGIRFLVAALDVQASAIPLPPDSIKAWPLVGASLYRLWTLAATNMRDALTEVLPMLRPVGGVLLTFAQSGVFALLELLVAIVVAGFLFPRGPQLVDALSAFFDRVISCRGEELVQLAGSTIRNVSQGVVGISLLQALLAGAGFLAASIPAAGVLAFLVLLLGVVQIGPAILFIPIVIWSWFTMDGVHAVLFTAYMLPVSLLDNILKPLLMARGLSTPTPVIMIGVIGGAIAYGFAGLFFGPIVLSVAWAVMAAWIKESDPSTIHEHPCREVAHPDKEGSAG